MTTTDTPISYDVFISYARADGRDLAERLYLALQDRRLRPWRDERDLNPYQDFSVGIERAIRAARYVVVLLTPEIAEREDSFVRREILEAQARHKPIIPLLCESFAPADVPISIKHLTYVEFTDFDANLLDLLNRLTESPGDYEPPPPSDDPFRSYVERLRDFVVGELEVSLLNIHDLILLRAKDTPDAVEGKPPPPLPTAFKSRVLSVNPKTEPSPPPERDFDDFNAGFAAHDGRVLLLGEPGAGKTTTLLAFTREKANARLTNPKAPLPLYAPLSSWDGKTELTDWLAASTGLDSAALRREIAEKRALLILDGLDEMPSQWHDPEKPDEKPRDFRLEFLKKLKSLDTAALVSCRVKDYDEIVGKGGEKIALNGAVTLQPLSDDQIKAYLHDQPELWDALQSDTALLDMGRTPLLLTLLAIGYRDSSPEERAQLRDLSASPGDLRDRIFYSYISNRYEHERLRSLDPLPFTLDQMIDGLGWAVVNMSSKYRQDHTKIAQEDFISHASSLPDFAVRLHLLQPIGMAKVERVLRYTGDDSDQFHWRFLHLLLQDYFSFHMAVTALSDQTRRNGVRHNAASALGQIGDSRAVEPLIAVLSDADAGVRHNAASALGQIGDPRAVEPLIGVLSDSVVYVRCCTVESLGQIGDPDAVQPLIAVLSDPEAHVRRRAAYALGQIGDPDAVQPLITLLSDPHELVRFYGAGALARIADPDAVRPLITLLSDSYAPVRGIAAYALGRIADPLAVETLRALLSDTTKNNRLKNLRVCDYAAQALTRIGTPEALAAVEAWRREQDKSS
jgi:HEAT repeat protein